MSVKISVFNKFDEGLIYINMKAKIDKMVLGIYFLFRSKCNLNVDRSEIYVLKFQFILLTETAKKVTFKLVSRE